jgi:CheY-like chemotaxis protein
MHSQAQNRVLVVDNDEDSLSRLGSALTEAGCQVRTTWSGIEALELLETNAFDVVLVDDYVPDLYIGDFLARITELRAHQPRVILMQNQPSSDKQTVGAQTIRVVDKKHTSAILDAVTVPSAAGGVDAKAATEWN